ncbi:TPA: ABC transporter substrate-binding protein [Yersinia enterocolitica]|nr:ABC transporter substrate-binding protein [Yersinia enterocolitica]
MIFNIYSIIRFISLFVFSASWSLANSNIQLTDMQQRTVHLEGPVKAAVVIPIPASSLLVSLDKRTARLAGIHPFAKVAAEQGILTKMYPAIASLPSDTVGHGFMPNIETLLSIQPDLVWQWGHLGNDIVDPIVTAGLNVALILYPYQDDTQMQQWVSLMGKSIGREQRATEIILWRQKALQDAVARVTLIPDEQKPRVLYLSRFISEIQTISRTSHTNQDILRGGGISITQDFNGPRTINQEQIIIWDPDIILLGNFETGVTPEDIYSSPALAEVTAVKYKKVYKIPNGGFIWDAPSQETPLYWQWLNDIFYPRNVLSSLKSNIVENYTFLYDYNLNQQEVNKILQLDANKLSAHYTELFKDEL